MGGESDTGRRSLDEGSFFIALKITSLHSKLGRLEFYLVIARYFNYNNFINKIRRTEIMGVEHSSGSQTLCYINADKQEECFRNEFEMHNLFEMGFDIL